MSFKVQMDKTVYISTMVQHLVSMTHNMSDFKDTVKSHSDFTHCESQSHRIIC
jgi:hypothetical protein